MRLDKRLSLIASLVRKGSRVSDIGTDHAYLPVWLVEQGHCPAAIASDIRKGPADRALQTVTSAKLTDHISVRLGNGLSTVSPKETDDIVIAGMGGETIASILNDAPWTKNAHYHFILQPMTKPEILREYLLKNGYALLEERVVSEGSHQYLVICSGFSPDTAVTQLKIPSVFYRGILDEDINSEYLTKLQFHLHLIADALRKAGNISGAEKLDKTASFIK